MKVTPIGKAGVSAPSSNSAANSKERAKAVFSGKDPNTAQAPEQVGGARDAVTSIKMNTQRTPPPDQVVLDQAAAPAAPADNSNPSESAASPSEESRTISPQVAAIVKRERAVQVKEAALEAKENAFKTAQDTKTVPETIKGRIKDDALGFLLENGATFEQLIHEMERRQSGPALTRIESELRAELKEIKESLVKKVETETSEEQQATERSLDQMQKDAEKLIAEDDDFQVIRETGTVGRVRALIKRTYDETGEILSVQEACTEVEADLIAQGEKFAKIGKIQSKIGTPAQQTLPNNTQNQMRTLTNRDTSVPTGDRRQRAIAAFHNKK